MENIILNKDYVLNITENNDYIISGIGNLVINVNSNVECKILIKNLSSNIVINLNKYSNLDLVSINYEEYSGSIVANVSEEAIINYKFASLTNTKDNLVVNLNGYKAKCNVEYLTINKESNSKFNQLINHLEKETESKVYNIGVVFDNASINFDTVGVIEKGNSKSICKQLSRGIIIGDNSTITSQPILKIDEYDVSANHGAAIGRMSDDELFYLMSRGLTKEASYKLILSGLVNPFIKSIWNENESISFKNKVDELI